MAREIGEFLRRALNGSHRGKSGREKLNPLQSRIYVVLRDIEGLVTEHPVRVYPSSVQSRLFASVLEAVVLQSLWGCLVRKRLGSVSRRLGVPGPLRLIDGISCWGLSGGPGSNSGD